MVFVAVVSGIGIWSAASSKVDCENLAAKWLVVDIGRGRAFHTLVDQDKEAAGIFLGNGFPSTPWSEAERFPWLAIGHATVVGPFEVEVPYGWCLGPQYGERGVRRYVCVWGNVWELRKEARELY
ncbi:MAG: hypothetical protein ACTHN5_00300 [Phycisphaerae bacterium]